MNKEEEIKKLQVEIKAKQEELNKLQQELLDEQLNKTEDLAERFKIWAFSDVLKVDHPYIYHCYAPSRGRSKICCPGTPYEEEEELSIDLFDNELVFDWSRYQILKIDGIAENLLEYYNEACEHPEGKLLDYQNKEESFDKEDILYWMETLMKENFGSCEMDW